MRKKQLFEAIKQEKYQLLSEFFLTASPQHVDTYIDFSTTNNYKSVWVGNYLYNLREKQKISEEQLMNLFLLADKNGNTWFHFISLQAPAIHESLLNFLTTLLTGKLLSSENFLSALFQIKNNFVILCTRKANPFVLKKLFTILRTLVKEKFIDVPTLINYFGLTMDKGWTFLHVLAYYQSPIIFQEFISCLLEWTKEDSISPEKIIHLFSAETEHGKLAFEFLKFNEDHQLLEQLIITLYGKSESSGLALINLISYSKTGNSMLYLFLSAKQKNKDNPPLINLAPLIDSVCKEDKGNIGKIMVALAQNTDVNSFTFLIKNPKLYSILVEHLLAYFKTENYPDENLHKTLGSLLLRNNEGLHHLHYVVKEAENLPFALILQIYGYLLSSTGVLIHQAPSSPSILHDPMQLVLSQNERGWTIFHLAARHLKNEHLVTFWESIERLLEDQQKFLQSQLTDSNFLKCSPLAQCLQSLLVEREEMPSFLYLLGARSSFDGLKLLLGSTINLVLNDRVLRLLFLQGILPHYEEILKAKTNEEQQWLKAYISRLIEKMHEFPALVKGEVECLEFYIKHEFPAAHYILYLYYKANKEAKFQDHLDACIKSNYIIAVFEQLLNEGNLKKRPEHFKYFVNPEIFVASLQEKRAFFNQKDVILLLKKAQSFYKEHPAIFNAIGTAYYEDGPVNEEPLSPNSPEFNLILLNINQISINTRSLSTEQHVQLSVIFLHLATLLQDVDNNNHNKTLYLYYGIRHFELAADNDNQFLQDQVTASLKNDPLLEAFYNLEQALDKSIHQSIKRLVPKLRDMIITIFSVNVAKATATLSMLKGWIENVDYSVIVSEFEQYTKAERVGSLFFNSFSNKPELLTIVHDIFKAIKSLNQRPLFNFS